MNGTKKTSSKVCLVSVDIESDFAKNKSFEGVDNLDYNPPTTLPFAKRTGTSILKIFEKYNISATLFVTGEVLDRYPELIKKWSKKYEIASHSFTHRLWDTLNKKEREKELENFISLHQKLFNQNPKGFRAPSHVIDKEGLRLLEEKGFLYDSSILPHYPFFKKYRGYKGKAPLVPYWLSQKLLEIPVTGQIVGIPLVGTWISKLPFFFYKFLFFISNPPFLTLNFHSWDSLDQKLLEKIEGILKLLVNKNYRFLTGEQIYEEISKNRG